MRGYPNIEFVPTEKFVDKLKLPHLPSQNIRQASRKLIYVLVLKFFSPTNAPFY
jgi:hypothetical protein